MSPVMTLTILNLRVDRYTRPLQMICPPHHTHLDTLPIHTARIQVIHRPFQLIEVLHLVSLYLVEVEVTRPVDTYLAEVTYQIYSPLVEVPRLAPSQLIEVARLVSP